MSSNPTDSSSRGGRTYAGRGYDVTYFARKHGLTRQQARDLIRRIGDDRGKLNAAAETLKS